GPFGAPQRQGSDFTTYLGNVERTSNISGEVLLNLTTLPKLQQLWRFVTNLTAIANKSAANPSGSGGIQSQTLEVNGTAYFGSQDGYEYAVNATTGHLLWSTFLGQDKNDTGCAAYYGTVGVVSTPTIVGSTMYLSGGDSHFYALNAATGQVEWQKVLGNDSSGYFLWASPLIDNGYAYVGVSAECGEPHVGAGLDQISLATHLVVNYFNTSVNDPNGSSVWGSPSLNPLTNTIYLPTGNPGVDSKGAPHPQSKYSESVLAMNATTLAVTSQFQVPSNQRIYDGDFGVAPTVFTPTGGPPMITAMDKNGILYAFNQSNLSSPRWEQNVTSGFGRISTAFGGDLVYAMSTQTVIDGVNYTGAIRAFDPLNGSIVWQDGFPQKPYNTYGAPVYVNGIVIVGDNTILDFINAQTGAILRSITYTGTIEPPISVARGEVFVGDMNGNETAYDVPTIAEYTVNGTVQTSTGQPLSGASVSYPTQGTNQTTFSNVSGAFQFDLPNGTYTFTASDVGYMSVNHTVVVNGAARSAGVFVLSQRPANLHVTRPVADPTHPSVGETTNLSVNVTGGTLPYTFIWLGLPMGCSSANRSSLSCTPTVPGRFVVYATVNDSVGTLVESPGLNLTVSPMANYTVTFARSGLPAGTSWGVTLNGSLQTSTTSTVAFTESNGTYNFTVGAVAGFTAGPTAGSVVINGANATQTINFTAVLYPSYVLTFAQTGLPSGASWEVTLNGTARSSTNSTVTFAEVNGTYGFSIGSVAGYTADPSSGSLTISGANASQAISFVAVVVHPDYAVTFTENGLPTATSWTVTLNATAHTSTNATVGFTEQNGTFSFSVGAVTGYTVAPSSGSIIVNGGPAVRGVTF
ncbi:MAG: PQQ-binding-like beta-propeller repeat protein, partial [Thermoplasmata archaeon]